MSRAHIPSPSMRRGLKQYDSLSNRTSQNELFSLHYVDDTLIWHHGSLFLNQPKIHPLFAFEVLSGLRIKLKNHVSTILVEMMTLQISHHQFLGSKRVPLLLPETSDIKVVTALIKGECQPLLFLYQGCHSPHKRRMPTTVGQS